MQAVEELANEVGISEGCNAMNVSRSTFYHRRTSKDADQHVKKERKPGTGLFRALTHQEREKALQVLHQEEYIDKAPLQIYASLLDQGEYICAPRTMYRILAAEDEVRERRHQKRRSYYKKPELLARGPNEVWSWDITRLKGPEKWTYFYLYVILDIFSRYCVGWTVAESENASLSRTLIEESCTKQQIEKGVLTIHSDRGSPMKSKTVAQLLVDLDVSRSLSRPSVSNDNPYSESQFKTLKYCPQFPKRFGSVYHARDFCREFINWYNNEHYHSGIGLLPPAIVHYHQADQVIKSRENVLLNAYQKHPERFTNKPPQPPRVPDAVWINPPKEEKSQS